MIAKKYRTSIGQLRRLNQLDRRSVLIPGQRLMVEGKIRKHTIRRGENLSTIARRYGVTVGQIARANALGRRAKIFAGKSLIIPD